MSNKIPYRFYLSEDQMPKAWYNLRADMPEQPDPLLNPATLAARKNRRPLPHFLRKACAAGNRLHNAVILRFPSLYAKCTASTVRLR